MLSKEWKELYEESEDKVKNLEKLCKNLQNGQIVSQQIIKEQKEKITLLEADTESMKRSPKNESEELVGLKNLIKEMKLRLDIAEKFETIDRIESYLKDFSVLFKFTDLIDQINDSSDVSALLDLNSKNQLERVTEFLPKENKPRTATELQRKAEELKAELKRQEEELLQKIKSLGLHEKFSDTTLERYFKLTEEDDGYTVEAFIAFENFEKILIPESYRGKKIIALKEKLFCKNKDIKTLVIEAPISVVPPSFCTRSLVETVILPDTVLTIEQYAFSESHLLEIKLSSNLKEIKKNAFEKTRLSSIDLPDSLERLSNYAFEYTLLMDVALPPKLKKLPFECFFNCKQLKTIELNENLEEIECNAVVGCDALEMVLIPKGVIKLAHFISKNAVIKCYPGSYAQQWGRENGYTIKNAEED